MQSSLRKLAYVFTEETDSFSVLGRWKAWSACIEFGIWQERSWFSQAIILQTGGLKHLPCTKLQSGKQCQLTVTQKGTFTIPTLQVRKLRLRDGQDLPSGTQAGSDGAPGELSLAYCDIMNNPTCTSFWCGWGWSCGKSCRGLQKRGAYEDEIWCSSV